MSESTRQTLRARAVFPVDAPPIENGCVTFTEGRIAEVGPARVADGKPLDLGDVALLPGFVNAHTHLEFSALERPLGEAGMPFADWIRLAILQRARRSHQPTKAIVAGCRESLQAGVTTVGEIVTADARGYAGAAPAPQITLFREVIGFSRARADSAYQAACEQLDEFHAVTSSALGISPHAPYTVSLQLVGRLVDLARERRWPLAMHLAESREEIEFLRDGSGPLRELLEERSMWDPHAVPPGSRPLDYLRLLAREPRVLVIHGNCLADDELDCLASHRDRMSLVHCARTHAYFQHDSFPLADVLTRGVRVVLGTDSRASNPDLSLLEEMRHVATHHAGVSPTDVLRMGTLGAAEALGRGESVGSLAVGKLANLVAVPLPPGAAGAAADLLAAVFASHERPSHVWLGGKPLAT